MNSRKIKALIFGRHATVSDRGASDDSAYCELSAATAGVGAERGGGGSLDTSRCTRRPADLRVGAASAGREAQVPGVDGNTADAGALAVGVHRPALPTQAVERLHAGQSRTRCCVNAQLSGSGVLSVLKFGSSNLVRAFRRQAGGKRSTTDSKNLT